MTMLLSSLLLLFVALLLLPDQRVTSFTVRPALVSPPASDRSRVRPATTIALHPHHDTSHRRLGRPPWRVVPFDPLVVLFADTQEDTEAVAAEAGEEEEEEVVVKEKQTLGLLTFDLDDTLYPIAPVVAEANAAFVRAMEQYGYTGLAPTDIVETGNQIREEISQDDPEQAAALTHTEIRELAIRRKMEEIIVQRKLQACADDWATQIDSLSETVKEHAKSWARSAVSESMVQAVLSAWEMERHHAAERHLYPEVIDALKQIRADHPDAIIGAVTDGRANPLFMTFTLAPFFDFSCSWEDDQGGRKQFFQDLERTGGETAELAWIYDEARYKYAILKDAVTGMNVAASATAGAERKIPAKVYPETYDDRVWIHIGDDLAFDIGGSAACGAKTIYCELADRYGQTARHRFSDIGTKPQPSWSTTPGAELKKRYQMNEAARDQVNYTVNYISLLPDVINEILEKNK